MTNHTLNSWAMQPGMNQRQAVASSTKHSSSAVVCGQVAPPYMLVPPGLNDPLTMDYNLCWTQAQLSYNGVLHINGSSHHDIVNQLEWVNRKSFQLWAAAIWLESWWFVAATLSSLMLKASGGAAATILMSVRSASVVMSVSIVGFVMLLSIISLMFMTLMLKMLWLTSLTVKLQSDNTVLHTPATPSFCLIIPVASSLPMAIGGEVAGVVVAGRHLQEGVMILATTLWQVSSWPLAQQCLQHSKKRRSVRDCQLQELSFPFHRVSCTNSWTFLDLSVWSWLVSFVKFDSQDLWPVFWLTKKTSFNTREVKNWVRKLGGLESTYQAFAGLAAGWSCGLQWGRRHHHLVYPVS